MSLDDVMKRGQVKGGLIKRLDLIAKRVKFGKDKADLSPASKWTVPEVVPTNIPELDEKILGIGGIPVGRVIEIAGETHAGKTTLALNICREFIAQDKAVVIAENEGTFTNEYAQKLGLDGDTYYLFEGHSMGGEEYLEGVLQLVEAGYDLVVMDSLSGILTAKSADAGVQSASMYTDMSTPKMVARWFRLLKNGWNGMTAENKGRTVKMKDTGCTLIIINHLKKNIMGDGFGAPEKESSGSEDLKFMYTYRIWLERLGMSRDDLDADGDPIYTRVRVTCAKNKLGPSGRHTNMFIDNRNGLFISDRSAVFSAAKRRGVIKVSGSWVHLCKAPAELRKQFKKGHRWHGKKEFIDYCMATPVMFRFVMGRGVSKEEGEISGR